MEPAKVQASGGGKSRAYENPNASIPKSSNYSGYPRAAALNFYFSYWDEESKEYVQFNEQNENTL